MKSVRDSLQTRYQQLDKWSKALVRGYGPGIWVSSEYIRPVYSKKPRLATVQGIIDELNESFQKHREPLLQLQKVENRVAYVGVDDDRKLVSQMGSSGAMEYVQSTAYSLNSLDDIDCVYFAIQEGDHAGPGKYCQ
jgi:hypothetical protein